MAELIPLIASVPSADAWAFIEALSDREVIGTIRTYQSERRMWQSTIMIDTKDADVCNRNLQFIVHGANQRLGRK